MLDIHLAIRAHLVISPDFNFTFAGFEKLLLIKVFVFATPTDIPFSIGGERERITRHVLTLHNFLWHV